jgi:broad specificity phosphatase PhoE
VQHLPDPRRPAPAAGDDARALRREQARRDEPDSGRRARHEAQPVAEAEIHGAASLTSMTTILLARHGETDWNVDRRVQGHSDRPLSDAGRKQARALAEQLANEQFDAVYSSDLVRAVETARVVAERKGLRITVLPELREKDFGSWEGLRDDEVLARFPDARQGHWGDGETHAAMTERVVAAVRRIAAAHPRGRVLVVAHGGPLRAVLLHCASDRDGPIGNCDVIRIEVDDGVLRVH